MDIFVDPDIKKACTLPSQVYKDLKIWETLKVRVFRPSWQYVGGEELRKGNNNLVPFSFLPGLIEEPLILSASAEEEICLSNVCTHRGKILVEYPQKAALIRCGYHGRCFRYDGSFKSMPEFEAAENFPTDADHLKRFHLERLGVFRFAAIDPEIGFADWIAPVIHTMPSFPFENLEYQPEYSAQYEVNAHWLAYCDNYLEGFHIPYVHKTLNEKISYDDYEVRCFTHCSVQIAEAAKDEQYLYLSESDKDVGRKLYAYYWFIYPNLMINIYSWGISVNIVQPVSTNRTQIIFKTYFLPHMNASNFKDTALHLTEMEDEAVVESVQKGLQSEAYNRGRFSPTREQAVHAFHLYLSRRLMGV